jgi:isopenicillin N synthase-like dioxygenase
MKVGLTVGPNRGYQPLGSRIYADKADAPDLNESFKYQHELSEDDPDVIAGNRVHALNRWPDNLPGWRETLLDYYGGMEHLTDALLRAFALALGLDEAWFLAAYRKPLTQINLIHYPPHPPVTAGRQFGLRPHSDTTAFTILAQGNVGGLQVEHGDDWIDVPPIPGSFVINIGDMMARWTNDRFASTPHRVINRSGSERYSVAFFAIPDFDAEVACLPSCMGPDNPPKYPPLRVGEFMLHSNATDWNKDLRNG